MKIKVIEAICKASKRIMLTEVAGAQWISDGMAAYPLYGMPWLDDSNIFTMFDISEDKREKFHIDTSGSFAAGISLNEITHGEKQAEPSSIVIHTGGYILLPIKTSLGIIYINKKYLAPFADSQNGVVLYERVSKSGMVYIAVKTGLFISGVISPVSIITKEFSDELSDLAELTSISLGRLSSVKDEELEQLSFQTE